MCWSCILNLTVHGHKIQNREQHVFHFFRTLDLDNFSHLQSRLHRLQSACQPVPVTATGWRLRSLNFMSSVPRHRRSIVITWWFQQEAWKFMNIFAFCLNHFVSVFLCVLGIFDGEFMMINVGTLELQEISKITATNIIFAWNNTRKTILLCENIAHGTCLNGLNGDFNDSWHILLFKTSLERAPVLLNHIFLATTTKIKKGCLKRANCMSDLCPSPATKQGALLQQST